MGRDVSLKQKAASDARQTYEHPFALLIKLYCVLDQDIQSLSVYIQKLRETGRILAQRLNRVKKKPVHRIDSLRLSELALLPSNRRSELVATITCP
jgi:hypothetical protein